MKRLISSLLALLIIVFVSCSNPKKDAVDQLRYFYEEMEANSEYYTQDDWKAIMDNYLVNDSIIRSYEYTPEEQQEIDDLRGRCTAYLIKGTAKEVKSEFEKMLKSTGDFLNGFSDELGK